MNRLAILTIGVAIGYVQHWLRPMTRYELAFYERYLAGRDYLFGPKE